MFDLREKFEQFVEKVKDYTVFDKAWQILSKAGFEDSAGADGLLDSMSEIQYDIEKAFMEMRYYYRISDAAEDDRTAERLDVTICYDESEIDLKEVYTVHTVESLVELINKCTPYNVECGRAEFRQNRYWISIQ